jgi:hypothetical protein
MSVQMKKKRRFLTSMVVKKEREKTPALSKKQEKVMGRAKNALAGLFKSEKDNKSKEKDSNPNERAASDGMGAAFVKAGATRPAWARKRKQSGSDDESEGDVHELAKVRLIEALQTLAVTAKAGGYVETVRSLEQCIGIAEREYGGKAKALTQVAKKPKQTHAEMDENGYDDGDDDDDTPLPQAHMDNALDDLVSQMTAAKQKKDKEMGSDSEKDDSDSEDNDDSEDNGDESESGSEDEAEKETGANNDKDNDEEDQSEEDASDAEDMGLMAGGEYDDGEGGDEDEKDSEGDGEEAPKKALADPQPVAEQAPIQAKPEHTPLSLFASEWLNRNAAVA